jgi:hypothetical protein
MGHGRSASAIRTQRRLLKQDARTTTTPVLTRLVAAPQARAAAAPVWVATAVAQVLGRSYSTSARLSLLDDVLRDTLAQTEGSGVLTFPGGWLTAGQGLAKSLIDKATTHVQACLRDYRKRDVAVSLGVDGREGRDQLAVAIGASGVLALGRKFFPTAFEADWVDVAADWWAGEDGNARMFEIGGRRFFLCVCYDIFGLKKLKLKNPGADVVLGFVHSFHPKSEGNSGDVLYARHGFAGAAKAWRVPVFGAVKFHDRQIPAEWPSGVSWSLGAKSTMQWCYRNNPIAPTQARSLQKGDESVETRIFAL